MRIYLLVLVLAVLAQTKFRHLRNLTITVPGQITLKGLSPSEIAYQYQDTIVIYDINRKQELQVIKQTAASPMQYVPSTNALIYPDGNNINQLRSNANQKVLNKPLPDDSWITNIGASGGDVVTAVYGQFGQDRILEIYGTGTNPSDYKRLTWSGFTDEDTNVGSGVSVVSPDEFYFAVGGSCKQDDSAAIYLQQGSRAGIKNVYNFSFIDCRSIQTDYEWTLQSYKINQVRYHLFTYLFVSETDKLSVSQLVSNQNGKYDEVAHFQIDRQIGAEMISKDVVYTADNILCRVLRHDIQNHDHGHNPPAFKDLPYLTFVSPSEKYVATMSVSDTTFKTSAQIYRVVNKDLRLFLTYIFQVFADRVEILNDQYVLVSSQTVDFRSVLSMSDLNGNITLKEIKQDVFDFCVSDQNVLFISDLPTPTDQTITAYKIVDGKLEAASTPIQVAKNSSLSLKCLNNNHILLAPAVGGPNTIYVYAYDNVDQLTLRSQNKSNSTTSIQFQVVNNIIINTAPEKNSYKFFDYDLKQLPLTFNLPANSVYEIVQATNGGLLVAVGDDLKHFVSLQYYAVDQLMVTYKGTYPYFDSGQSNHPGSVLLPNTGILHIQYDGWSTYYDLNAPPMTSFGYFYGKDNQCSGFSDAVFQVTATSTNMIVLNQDTPSIEVYAITDKLEKQSSYPIDLKSSYLSLKKSSNPNEIIISGINDKSNYVIEVRNINAISQPIFSTEKAFTARQKKIESTQVANQLIVSAFTDDTSMLTLFFDPNSNTPIPLENSQFKAITLIATCPACSKIAFTGDLVAPVTGATIIVQDYEDLTNYESVDASCKINLLAVSPSGEKLAYNCDTNQLIVYASAAEIVLAQTFTTISDLAFLDENSLIANLDGKITTILITAKNLHVLKGGINAANGIYAVDYNKQIYAVTNGPSTVDFYNVAGPLIESITINSIDQISSMSFNPNDELVVITLTGTIVVLTMDSCNIDQNLFEGYFCVCKSLFKQNVDQCTCDYKYDSAGGNCNCNDGYFYAGDNNCDQCSSMCSTCSSGGAFDCEDFGAWFYVIIIGGILIIAGGVLFAVFRLKKKLKQDTMYTEEKSKQTEPFLSQKESERDRRGSKNKLHE